MNTDANFFAGYEPNTSGRTEDLGGNFDLAGAAGRAARTGSVFGAIRGQLHHNSHRHGRPGLGMNPLGPTLRAETQTDPKVPPVPEEEGEVTVEAEDPSTELLRRMLAGASTFRGSNSRESQLRQDLEVCRQPQRGKTGSRSS